MDHRTTRKPSFWTLQLGGWLVYAISVVVTSIPLRHEADYVAFRITYVLSGFLASFLLYPVCHAIWNRKLNLLASLAACTPACLLLGFLCSSASVWAEAQFGGVNRPFRWTVALSGITGTGFLFLAWCAMYFGVKHYQALEQKQLQLAQSESLARDAQLRALRYQLQPHFLFNTLNAISTLVLEGRQQDARRMIARLADLLRNTIEAPDTDLIELSEELLLVEQYLAIEQVRFGDRLRVKLSQDMLVAAAHVPRLILQPLVENAVRHGIASLLEGGEISIASSVNSGMLTLCVTNDCPDSQSVASNGSERCGVGIANARSRLEKLYGGNQSLQIGRSWPGKFEVTIRLPLDTSMAPSATHKEMIAAR